MKRALIGVLALAFATMVWAQEAVDQRLQAAKTGVVEISNVAGSVTVTGWDDAEVWVKGTLGRGTERLEFRSVGDRTVVRVVLPQDSHHVDGSTLEIRVPRQSRLDVETVSADITVDEVVGREDLQSVSGTIAVRGAPSELVAETVSGGLNADVTTERARLESVSGDIEVKTPSREIEVNTVSGAISAFGEAPTSVRLETVSGRLGYEGGLAKGARCEVSSVSGTVELAFPADVDADFEVSTFSGTIRNELGGTAERREEHGHGHEHGEGHGLSFVRGSGSARVVAESFSGAVHIRTR